MKSGSPVRMHGQAAVEKPPSHLEAAVLALTLAACLLAHHLTHPCRHSLIKKRELI